MYPQQIHDYLLRFFRESHCQILNDHDHYIDVQLTIEMDKKIMNRPFYWRYLESTDGVPNPAQLTFITDRTKLVDDIKGEVVHFGSPRLSQLFQATKEMGSFVQMYEKVLGKFEKKTILTPWLGVNYKVSYYSDQTKEFLYSLGINLMTGHVVEGFQESLSKVDLDIKMSEHTFNLPYIIKPIRALERLDAVIEKNIQQDDHTWAEEAKKRKKKDQKVLEHFYEGVENKPDCYEVEKEAMEQQYEARIKIDIINGGLFYLK
ncbi:YqhG family protein [Sporosarcina sp. G11-34]|uniref:YqhG family protein n=1 Tax=Sporosarcina sp. G11-34 TaxID=2849605 RepID=UPI0022A9CB12|nr:YqhG family protein [Sporosarcina sp. G11-34]MCZ2259927.1 YqhG family protein [Sporosarcina sp. G11-34]